MCPVSIYVVMYFIHYQTRYPALENPESLRKSADDFLTQATITDAGLLFPPSQIALTAILNSASRAGLIMERWVVGLVHFITMEQC